MDKMKNRKKRLESKKEKIENIRYKEMRRLFFINQCKERQKAAIESGENVNNRKN